VERLEGRTVLSAGLSAGACFDLAIQGTDIQYSPLGLPAAMGGDIYLAGQAHGGHASIGHYQESLTPILMDVNGDSIPDFVGTQGLATFTFFVATPAFSCGSITTVDTSFIQGVTPAGQMHVGSQGTIVSNTGLFVGLSGGFISQSTVGLSPSFQMQTNVHFTVNKPSAPIFSFLAAAADFYAGLNTPTNPSVTHACQGGVTSTEEPITSSSGVTDSHGAAGHSKKGHDAPIAHHHVHDDIFSEDANWLSDPRTSDSTIF